MLFQWSHFTLPGPQPGTQRLNTDTTQIEGPLVSEAHQDHNYCSTTEPAEPDLSLDHTEDTVGLQKQMEDAAISNKFGLERFAASDEDIRFYTRWANKSFVQQCNSIPSVNISVNNFVCTLLKGCYLLL